MFVADLGITDGYRKTLCSVEGSAWIAAGCRWFALKDALRHWRHHREDRRDSYACMKYARDLAKIHDLTV